MRGVPLRGAWENGGFWMADDLAYAEGAQVLLWEPREGSVPWAATAGATAPTMRRGGFMGRPGINIDGASNQRMRADALAALQNGTDLPITIWAAIQPRTGTNGCVAAFTAAASTPYHILYFNASGNISCLRDAAPTATFACPVVTGRQNIAQVFTGTSSVLYNDKKVSASIAQDRSAALGVTQVVLGNFFRTSASTPFDGVVRAVGMTPEQLTASDIVTLENFMYGNPGWVWFLGNSITAGTDPGAAGMRRPTSNLIALRNFQADMLGTLDLGTLWSRTRHDGHSGFNISNTRGVVAANFGAGKAIPWAKLVCLMIGTNDMGTGPTPYDPVATPASYAALLEEIHAADPFAWIAATTIPPIDPAVHAAADANRVDFNSKLPAIYAAFRTAHPTAALLTWDAAGCLGNAWNAANYIDPFHLNATGYGLIANDPQSGLLRTIKPALATQRFAA